MPTLETNEVYGEFLKHTKRIGNLSQALMVLHWDQQVKMPEGGMFARSKQISAISEVGHDLITDNELGRLLDDLSGADLDAEQQAIVREMRREHKRAADTPSDLVKKIAESQSEAQRTWLDAKNDNDFDAFAPTLQELRNLHIERAGHVNADAPPYRVLFEDREPHLPLETVNQILDRLREELRPLVDAIRANDTNLATPFEGIYPEDKQIELCEDALNELGYDWNRGRLDKAPHPFMVGNQFDARVTTRFKPEDPIDALMSTVHEFGHATYQLGLCGDSYGTPLGQSHSQGIHESQSRFWENHIARTRAFWELFLPKMKERFPRLKDVTVEEAYEAVNRINPNNLIRLEADELTYHFHILIRAEIDSAFIAGDLNVEEIPRVWNNKMEEYLEVRPKNDTEGCLQDIHWSSGFAQFQNYTIGSVLAAQLHAAVEDDLGPLDNYIREGDFGPIHDWMTEHIHRHGKRYPTDELVEVATGETLTAEHFIDYVNRKFNELYNLQ